MNPVVIGLAFLAGFLVVFGVNVLLADIQIKRKVEMKDRMRAEQRLMAQERAKARLKYKELAALAADTADEADEDLSWKERIEIFLDQAGNPMSLVQWSVISVGLLVLVAAAAWVFLGSLTMAVGGGLIASLAPTLFIVQSRSKRLGLLRAQLADGFDLMGRTIRAGQTFSQALLAIADEAAAPLAEEFGYCYDQQNLGMSVEQAMRDLAKRTGILEVRIFVLAVLVHRQTGGNLAELLDKLSDVIRQRQRIQGMIRGLTAEGKMQAVVLLGLPFGMGGMIYVLNREYIELLFTRPWWIAGTLVLMTLGGVWIQKLINFDH